ncbi:MAG TPA: T9SS type A sorting domain-containing protein [candidate division WOR-3 bacterium]|uniref:T9SS type A sorting domain-containing protein n=1 Tax=candidate division WOR-3 bacterium TaxID=2052148 RepID=A0A9C9ELS2_UNCW3|nr:T9SS type A sorting domain-containing protein [candidate division WOR-3 bacterium]
MKRYASKAVILLLAIAVTVGWSNAIAFRNGFQRYNNGTDVKLNYTTQISNHYITMRAEFVDSFERTTLDPWTSSGQTNWGIRDTTNTYGPQAPAVSGYQYPGHPATDTSSYPCSGSNPGLITYLTSPTIDLTGWDSLFISFNYWGDFEGEATNFDGGIVEISTDDGSTWTQIDPNAQGHLNPTYDSQLAGTGQLGNAWAYCYDTDPDWVAVSSQNLMALGYAANGDQLRIRFTFASDALSGGQGWFIDDIRIADTPPPDLQPPVITHTPLNDTPDTLNAYVISATVVDDGSGVDYDSVYLHYQIESGSVVDVKMDTVGTGNPDVYEATIPAQNYHTDIYYQITAADLAGNEAATPVYNFEVTNALTIQYDDGQPYWIPGDLQPGSGLFVQFHFNDVGIDSGLLHKAMLYFDGPGPFDLHIYQAGATQPGSLIDSLQGLISNGYEIATVEITTLDIQTRDDVVVGFISQASGGDTTRVLMDPVQEYPTHMWGWLNGAWTQPGYDGGDFMIRLKVIPITYTGVEERGSELSAKTTLYQITPNPLRNNALIRYQIPSRQQVKLNIYDVSGQLVKTLVNEIQNPGSHEVVWNARDAQGAQVASGVYFLKLTTGDTTETQKILLIK